MTPDRRGAVAEGDAGPERISGLPPVPPRRAAGPAAQTAVAADARPAGRVHRTLAGVRTTLDRVLGVDPAAEDAEQRSGRAAYVLFALAVLAYVAHQLATRGRMILDGSMWAEMATNYYATTTTEPWYAQLVATDAGYIPLPQRVIALVFDVVGAPVASIPYVYTGTSVLFSGLLIGSICLPAFRPVVQSDVLRFALACALTVLPDFESRTFINFTYFTVVLAGFVTALAAVNRRRDVPAWSWVLPVLMISKPGVLTVLPAMVLVALFSRRRFRLITAASVVAGCAQAVRLALSARSGPSLLQDSDATLVDKLISAVKYTLGILGRFSVGPGPELSVRAWMGAGLVVLVLALAAVVLLRSRAGALVLVGLSMLSFTMLLNSFTFSSVFTRQMPMLGVPDFDRRYLVAVVGALFVVAGLLAAVVESPVLRSLAAARRPAATLLRWGAPLAVAAFALWFVASGWLLYSVRTNKPMPAPTSGVSQWDDAAPLLASDLEVVCVPLDPFGWPYGRNCGALAGGPVDAATVGFPELPAGAEGRPQPLELTVPETVRDGRLAALAVVVRPGAADVVRATAVLTAGDGTATTLQADEALPPSGGSLLFTVPDGATVEDVTSVVVQFGSAVHVASTTGDPADALTLWMGQP